MRVHQFYDEGLAHASYAVLSAGEIALIDPARNPEPYLDFASEHQAKVTAIIETHPHADFVSSHLELHQVTGAPIYTSRLVNAEYPHQPFNDGESIRCGSIRLEAIDTPGHSPDSICVLLVDAHGKPNAVFTGDTLFVGDVGRPDLREDAGKFTEKAIAFATSLYHSLHEKLATLPSGVTVYPAHGPGSLCGKNMGSDLHSTIGRETRENYALQPMEPDEFVTLILAEQPFVPKYFAYNVAVNKAGAAPFRSSIAAIPIIGDDQIPEAATVVDGRPQAAFKAGHHPGAINIPDGTKFETWLGSIIAPDESFYLLAANRDELATLLEKAAKIGYERHINGAVISNSGSVASPIFDVDAFKHNPQKYTIVDIRNQSERTERNSFPNAIHIPLHELRDRIRQVPTEKPIAVHCAGGYRSAIGSSILAAALDQSTVLDIGEHIETFNIGR